MKWNLTRYALIISLGGFFLASNVLSVAESATCPLNSSSKLKTVLAKGEKIYNSSCGICHAPAMASTLNAVPAHDMQQWKPYIVDACKNSNAAGCSGKDLKNPNPLTASCVLLPIAKTGKQTKGIMPAKGNCTKCSDKDLQSAIVFMLSKKK